MRAEHAMTTRILYIYIYISYVLVHEKITTLNLEKLELRRNVVEYEVRWVYFKDFKTMFR